MSSISRMVLSSRTMTDNFSVPKSKCLYTACYCEENVYMLCKKLAEKGLCKSDFSDLVVMFVSNKSRQIILWCQISGYGQDNFICWDYHVILIKLGLPLKSSLVFDLDSTLPFPCSLSTYLQEAFWKSSPVPFQFLDATFNRLLRIVRGTEFIRYFSSDRSHMRNKPGGSWTKSPPPYECIRAEDGSQHNLESYISMDKEEELQGSDWDLGSVLENKKFGVVVGEIALQKLFGLYQQPD